MKQRHQNFGEIPPLYKGKIVSNVGINLYNSPYLGNTKITCPITPGAIAQGKGNENALLNLYGAILESLLLISDLGMSLTNDYFSINDQVYELPLIQSQISSTVYKKGIEETRI